MFCTNCGKELHGGKFCPYCGNRIPDVASSSPVSSPIAGTDSDELESVPCVSSESDSSPVISKADSYVKNGKKSIGSQQRSAFNSAWEEGESETTSVKQVDPFVKSDWKNVGNDSTSDDSSTREPKKTESGRTSMGNNTALRTGKTNIKRKRIITAISIVAGSIAITALAVGAAILLGDRNQDQKSVSDSETAPKVYRDAPGWRQNEEDGVFINFGYGLHVTKGVIEPTNRLVKSDVNVVLTRDRINKMPSAESGLLIVSSSSLREVHLYPVIDSGYTFPLGFGINRKDGSISVNENKFYWGNYHFPVNIVGQQYCEIKEINEKKVSDHVHMSSGNKVSSICGYPLVWSSSVNYVPGVGSSEGHYRFGDEDGYVFLKAEEGETATFGYYAGTKFATQDIKADAIYCVFDPEIPVKLYQTKSGVLVDTSSLSSGKYVMYIFSYAEINGYYIFEIQ